MTIKSRICEVFGIKYPIFLAGMGGAANPKLASAVSNSGVLKVDLDSLGLIADSQLTTRNSCFVAKNYLEAAALLLSLREGLSISSLKRPVDKIIEI